MADEGFKRKLTAILSADVVGYSQLMEDNEDATTLNIMDNPHNYREINPKLSQLRRLVII